MIRYQMLLLLAACCATPSGPTIRAQASPDVLYRNTVDVGTVDQEAMDAALLKVKRLTAEGEHEITLRIDSPGGAVMVGLAWIRAIEDVKKLRGTHVTCAVDGLAMSMAAVILESPICDTRLATARSIFLFHNGSGTAEGTAEQMQTTQDLLSALNEAMALLVSSRIGMPYSRYCERIAHGNWILSTRSALAYNVIDGIISPATIMPPVDG